MADKENLQRLLHESVTLNKSLLRIVSLYERDMRFWRCATVVGFSVYAAVLLMVAVKLFC